MTDPITLSKRVRPDVEAAPWVIAEIKRLEKAFAGMTELKQATTEQRDTAQRKVVALTADIAKRDELLTHWDHCLSFFYGNNIIDSVRRAMRCVRDGVETPKPWEPRPDYENEMVKLKADNKQLTTEVTNLRELASMVWVNSTVNSPAGTDYRVPKDHMLAMRDYVQSTASGRESP